jgi:hypothetical protein
MSEDLRETVAAAFEQHSGGEAPADETPAPSTHEAESAPAPAESESARAERLRDEKGRFAATPEAPAPIVQPAEGAPAPVAAPRRAPQSWKKELWEDFQKLDPRVQDYIEQREREAANGVHQYRSKAESLAAIDQAIAPFMSTLQQHGVQPAQWISSLGEAQRVLVQGTPAQKLAMFAKLAQDYQVPIEHIQNPAVWQQLQPQQAPIDPRAAVREELQVIESEKQVQSFLADVEAGKYPHFEEVSQPMDGLLRSGLANDLPTAYKMACRTRDDLFDAELQQREQARQEEAKQATMKARAASVSVRSSAPTGPVADAGKPMDIRATVAEAFRQRAGGRV